MPTPTPPTAVPDSTRSTDSTRPTEPDRPTDPELTDEAQHLADSRTALARPEPRLFLILKSVYAAPTSIPPTAIGRTTNRQT